MKASRHIPVEISKNEFITLQRITKQLCHIYSHITDDEYEGSSVGLYKIAFTKQVIEPIDRMFAVIKLIQHLNNMAIPECINALSPYTLSIYIAGLTEAGIEVATNDGSGHYDPNTFQISDYVYTTDFDTEYEVYKRISEGTKALSTIGEGCYQEIIGSLCNIMGELGKLIDVEGRNRYKKLENEDSRRLSKEELHGLEEVARKFADSSLSTQGTR